MVCARTHTLASPRIHVKEEHSEFFVQYSVSCHQSLLWSHLPQSNCDCGRCCHELCITLSHRNLKICLNTFSAVSSLSLFALSTFLHSSPFHLFISNSAFCQTGVQVLSARRALEWRPAVPCNIQSTAHHFTSLTTVSHFPNNSARTAS